MLGVVSEFTRPLFFGVIFFKEGNMPQFVTITKAIGILNISRPTIYRKIKAREIPSVHCGKKVLIPIEFFQRLQDEALNKVAENN